jgi:DNA-binding transcriptional LysR family regulator
LRIIYESRDTHALVTLAKKGLCTAVLHDEMLDPQQARSAARIVVGRRLLSIQLHLTWRPLKQLSPAARALRNVMLRRAKERRIPGDDRVR